MSSRPPVSAWQADVEIRARQLEEGLATAKARRGENAQAVQGYLDTYALIVEDEVKCARETMKRPNLLARFGQWLTGSALESAWRSLHSADAALIMIAPKQAVAAAIPEIQASLNTVLGPNDGRTQDYVKMLPVIAKDIDANRDQLRIIRTTIDAASDVAHANLRSYRNWLLGLSAIVTCALAGVAVAHALDSSFIVVPVESKGQAADLGQVEAAGGVGGLLTALFALIRLKVYSGPFALPFWQAVIRIPSGAAAALVGTVLLQANLLPAFQSPSTTSGLLAYAVLFGAAPEIVLRFLDTQINKVSDAARTKDDPLKDVPAQSTTTPAADTSQEPATGTPPAGAGQAAHA